MGFSQLCQNYTTALPVAARELTNFAVALNQFTKCWNQHAIFLSPTMKCRSSTVRLWSDRRFSRWAPRWLKFEVAIIE